MGKVLLKNDVLSYAVLSNYDSRLADLTNDVFTG